MQPLKHYVIIRHMRLAVATCALFWLAASGCAQTVDATHMGEPVSLSHGWVFRAGDSPQFADPGFNDSDWKPWTRHIGWFDKTSGLNGYFWYRLHVKLPRQHGPLELYIDYMANPYEVFANGQAIGQFGQFPPGEKILRPLVRTFPIPAKLVQGEDLVLAFRCWTKPIFGWGGLPQEAVLLGTTPWIQKAYEVNLSRVLYTWVPDLCVRFFALLLGTGLLVLYYWDRRQSEYLWIALYFYAMTAWTVALNFQTVVPETLLLRSCLDLGLTDLAEILLLQFVFAFLKQRMPVWVRVYQLSLIFHIVAVFAAFGGWANEIVLNVILLVWNLPYAFLLPGIVLWKYLRGNKEAGLLFLPLLLINFNDMLSSLGWILYQLKLRATTEDIIPRFYWGVVPVYVGQLEGLLFLLSLGAILLYRFHRTSREQARAQAELEAARSMQEVMVPKHLQATPGFSIESAYIPAQEVGGDFFQVFPGADGSLLVVIGDVSGKGVKAAMLVSLIMGLLQKTVEETREPVRILRELNRLLQGQTDGRFATCICALIARDGRVYVANAGHLSPYCQGKEIEVAGGLPLGLSPDAVYEQAAFSVGSGQRLLFLSDGVVEARSKSGELYGFERTRTLSIQPVSQIAQTAKQFGQEDDITVVGIERQAVAFA